MQGPVARIMARAVARVTCLWLSFQVSMPLPSFLGKNDMGTGWGGSRPAEASKGRGDIAGASRGWFQTSGPGPGKGILLSI